MTVEQSHDAKTQGETSWAWPVNAFVAWLATILGYVTGFKRIRHTQRCKPDWRDSWQDLRQSEWLSDQLIAHGVVQLLADQPLQLDDKTIQLTPPATYGGPCPRTRFAMSRRFRALANWAADPEAMIRARFRRLVARSRLAVHDSTDALRAAHHDAVGVSIQLGSTVALILSSDRRERPSKDEGGLSKARGPPSLPRLPIPHYLAGPPPARTPPHAPH